jgi:hypothetical protein
MFKPLNAQPEFGTIRGRLAERAGSKDPAST